MTKQDLDALQASAAKPKTLTVSWVRDRGWAFDANYEFATDKGWCDGRTENTAGGLFDAIKTACAGCYVDSGDYTWTLVNDESVRGDLKG